MSMHVVSHKMRYGIYMIIGVVMSFYCSLDNIALAQQATSNNMQKLLAAYPDFLISARNNQMLWKDGSKMVYDDGIPDKDFFRKLAAPDLEDQMSIPYPLAGERTGPPKVDQDPGRIRYKPFFARMYGDSKNQVRSHLTQIVWMPNTTGQKISVTTINQVDRKLKAVSAELERLPERLKKYVSKLSGTFNWRQIDGTHRLSAHSWGIAVDLNIAYADYWNWHYKDPKADIIYRNRIPLQIVAIFEKHGFIWGGNWYHYDTMHFEYRPELILRLIAH